MKTNIHPKYVEATVTCACGNSWTTRSTRTRLHTDLCSKCHPFYTGEQRIVDTAGQVDRFMRRMGKRQEPQARRAAGTSAPVAVSAADRPTIADVADTMPVQEPAAAAGVGNVADSGTTSAPLGEGMARQLEPEAVAPQP